MPKFLRITGIAIMAAYLSGCGFVVSNYGASAENVDTLRTLKTDGMQVHVNSFTSSKPGVSGIACRAAGSVETPDKKPFDQYIHDALVTELKLAGLYSENGNVVLDGNVQELDFSSNIGSGKWIFKLKASSNNGKSLTVDSQHIFSTNWVADKACQQVAQAFSNSVQVLIHDLVSNPQFADLLAAPQLQAADNEVH